MAISAATSIPLAEAEVVVGEATEDLIAVVVAVVAAAAALEAAPLGAAAAAAD